MWRGVWLAVIGCVLGVGACSGGYPLPPTRCDEFCQTTHGFQCETGYQPAGCVSICEQGNLDIEACDVQFQALLTCFRTTPGALDSLCFYGSALPYENVQPISCQAQRDLLGICIGAVQLGVDG